MNSVFKRLCHVCLTFLSKYVVSTCSKFSSLLHLGNLKISSPDTILKHKTENLIAGLLLQKPPFSDGQQGQRRMSNELPESVEKSPGSGRRPRWVAARPQLADSPSYLVWSPLHSPNQMSHHHTSGRQHLLPSLYESDKFRFLAKQAGSWFLNYIV